jgi:hypothetical protein
MTGTRSTVIKNEKTLKNDYLIAMPPPPSSTNLTTTSSSSCDIIDLSDLASSIVAVMLTILIELGAVKYVLDKLKITGELF